MKVAVFSSGSCGNCTLLTINNKRFLVDCGISKKLIDSNLMQYNLTLNDIDALFITHEHQDHIKSLATLMSKNENMVIYMPSCTYKYCEKSFSPKQLLMLLERFNNNKIVIFNRINNSLLYEGVSFEDISIDILPLFHDAKETVGFVFKTEEKKLVYITDTGYVHQALFETISNCDCYILESNHDPEMQMHSERPYDTKMRILSDHGHLSNDDSMMVLASVMGDKTKLVMHAHISQDCNMTELVELSRRNIFNEYGISTKNIEFVILSPNPTKEMCI